MGRKSLQLSLKAEFCFCSGLSGVALGSPSTQVCKNKKSLYGGAKNEGLVRIHSVLS